MRYPFTEARLVIIEKSTNGVPVVAQQKQIQPLTMRFQVQSLASFSGLRIRRGCELWSRSQTRLVSHAAEAVV